MSSSSKSPFKGQTVYVVKSGTALTPRDAVTSFAAIGRLPQPSALEAVNLPGQPVTYRVRRDLVLEAARNVRPGKS